MAATVTVTTSYLLGNLHCPSCVTLIKSLLLEAYGDLILWVSPNLVTSVVTVEHVDDAKTATVSKMARTLEDAGFEIAGVNTTAVDGDDWDPTSLEAPGESSASANAWSRLWRSSAQPLDPRDVHAAHLENCEACRVSATRGTDARIDEKTVQVHSISSSPPSEKPQTASPLSGVVVDDGTPTPTWRATLSIGGMTCAVCVNTITNEIGKYPWISNIAVNLVANSATVDYTDSTHTQEIVDAIEDLGYEAGLDKVVNLAEQKQSSTERDVEIHINGIFCHHCPERICQTLKTFGAGSVQILQEPSLAHPHLKLRYTPDAPQFTIRHILRAIEAADPALHPVIFHPPTLEEKSKAIRARHQRQLLGRMILTAIVTVPTFVLGIVYMSLLPHSNPSKMYLMEPWKSGLSRLSVSLCILATPVYFFAADIFHVRAIKEVRTMWRRGSRMPLMARFYKFGSMNMLMSLGTSIAYFSSIAQMIVVATGNGKTVSAEQFYFDSVVFLTLFLLGGRLIEGYSKSKTGNAVEALARLRPSTALLIETDKTQRESTSTIEIDQLECGDVIRVPHGASPAADGVVLSGGTSFDESSLTGESRLVAKEEGDKVFSGTINKGSPITVRVTEIFGKSMLGQIVEVVREGQTKRAPIEHLADILTTYFVPVVTLVALVTWAIWLALASSNIVPDHKFKSTSENVAFAFKFAIAVFVIACPCGLALAAPTAIFVGGGLAAKHGILAKGGGEAFEKASRIDCVVFDKTGTLTEGGEPKITASVFYDGTDGGLMDRQTVLSALKSVEEMSSHPIATAIVDFCGSEAETVELTSTEEVPGKGMRATCESLSLDILVGNEQLMRDNLVSLSPETLSHLEIWKTEAKSVALVATKPAEGNWSLAAALAISDPIRPEAVSVIATLQSGGTQVWMLSGDNITTARAVAQRVGIPPTNVLAEVLPSEKAAKITYLQATLHGSSTRRATVAMVGDGINDAPALATADVGIAIGSGSDVAISTADFVLATSNLAAVPTLLRLSRAVLRRVRANFAWALVYNLVAVPIAAGCLYPIPTTGEHIVLDPAWASLAMALSSISVVLSSLSLRSRLPGVGFRAQPCR